MCFLAKIKKDLGLSYDFKDYLAFKINFGTDL